MLVTKIFCNNMAYSYASTLLYNILAFYSNLQECIINTIQSTFPYSDKFMGGHDWYSGLIITLGVNPTVICYIN